MPSTVEIIVKRGIPSQEPKFKTYLVPYREGMSVLDAIVWIRSNIDSSLAFRYSCINANACKECMVLIDGKVKYACAARLMSSSVILEPLPNKVLIKDLVTDIVPPKENIHFINKNILSNS